MDSIEPDTQDLTEADSKIEELKRTQKEHSKFINDLQDENRTNTSFRKSTNGWLAKLASGFGLFLLGFFGFVAQQYYVEAYKQVQPVQYISAPNASSVTTNKTEIAK